MPRKGKNKKRGFLNNIDIDLDKINLNPSRKIQETKNKITNFYESYKKERLKILLTRN